MAEMGFGTAPPKRAAPEGLDADIAAFGLESAEGLIGFGEAFEFEIIGLMTLIAMYRSQKIRALLGMIGRTFGGGAAAAAVGKVALVAGTAQQLGKMGYGGEEELRMHEDEEWWQIYMRQMSLAILQGSFAPTDPEGRVTKWGALAPVFSDDPTLSGYEWRWDAEYLDEATQEALKLVDTGEMSRMVAWLITEPVMSNMMANMLGEESMLDVWNKYGSQYDNHMQQIIAMFTGKMHETAMEDMGNIGVGPDAPGTTVTMGGRYWGAYEDEANKFFDEGEMMVAHGAYERKRRWEWLSDVWNWIRGDTPEQPDKYEAGEYLDDLYALEGYDPLFGPEVTSDFEWIAGDMYSPEKLFGEGEYDWEDDAEDYDPWNIKGVGNWLRNLFMEVDTEIDTALDEQILAVQEGKQTWRWKWDWLNDIGNWFQAPEEGFVPGGRGMGGSPKTGEGGRSIGAGDAKLGIGPMSTYDPTNDPLNWGPPQPDDDNLDRALRHAQYYPPKDEEDAKSVNFLDTFIAMYKTALPAVQNESAAAIGRFGGDEAMKLYEPDIMKNTGRFLPFAKYFVPAEMISILLNALELNNNIEEATSADIADIAIMLTTSPTLGLAARAILPKLGALGTGPAGLLASTAWTGMDLAGLGEERDDWFNYLVTGESEGTVSESIIEWQLAALIHQGLLEDQREVLKIEQEMLRNFIQNNPQIPQYVKDQYLPAGDPKISVGPEGALTKLAQTDVIQPGPGPTALPVPEDDDADEAASTLEKTLWIIRALAGFRPIRQESRDIASDMIEKALLFVIDDHMFLEGLFHRPRRLPGAFPGGDLLGKMVADAEYWDLINKEYDGEIPDEENLLNVLKMIRLVEYVAGVAPSDFSLGVPDIPTGEFVPDFEYLYDPVDYTLPWQDAMIEAMSTSMFHPDKLALSNEVLENIIRSLLYPQSIAGEDEVTIPAITGVYPTDTQDPDSATFEKFWENERFRLWESPESPVLAHVKYAWIKWLEQHGEQALIQAMDYSGLGELPVGVDSDPQMNIFLNPESEGFFDPLSLLPWDIKDAGGGLTEAFPAMDVINLHPELVFGFKHLGMDEMMSVMQVLPHEIAHQFLTIRALDAVAQVATGGDQTEIATNLLDAIVRLDTLIQSENLQGFNLDAIAPFLDHNNAAVQELFEYVDNMFKNPDDVLGYRELYKAAIEEYGKDVVRVFDEIWSDMNFIDQQIAGNVWFSEAEKYPERMDAFGATPYEWGDAGMEDEFEEMVGAFANPLDHEHNPEGPTWCPACSMSRIKQTAEEKITELLNSAGQLTTSLPDAMTPEGGWDNTIYISMSGITQGISRIMADSEARVNETVGRLAQRLQRFATAYKNYMDSIKAGGDPVISAPHLGIQAYATGGIVDAPEIALIGEAGPEAIIPLNSADKDAPLRDALKNLPMLAQGGIVDSATIAMIGEAGPEAVIPLPDDGIAIADPPSLRHGTLDAIHVTLDSIDVTTKKILGMTKLIKYELDGSASGKGSAARGGGSGGAGGGGGDRPAPYNHTGWHNGSYYRHGHWIAPDNPRHPNFGKDAGKAAGEAMSAATGGGSGAAVPETKPATKFVSPWTPSPEVGMMDAGPSKPPKKFWEDLMHQPGRPALTPRMFATGGIVYRPTLGIVGEEGPEAVIPLTKQGLVMRKDVSINQNFYGDFYGFDSFKERVGDANIELERGGHLD